MIIEEPKLYIIHRSFIDGDKIKHVREEKKLEELSEADLNLFLGQLIKDWEDSPPTVQKKFINRYNLN